MDIIFKLDNLLKDKGISRRELSRLTDIRPQTINDMCNNSAVHLPLENLSKICEVLNCEIADILELKKEQSE